jgi:hypothetical protein
MGWHYLQVDTYLMLLQLAICLKRGTSHATSTSTAHHLTRVPASEPLAADRCTKCAGHESLCARDSCSVRCFASSSHPPSPTTAHSRPNMAHPCRHHTTQCHAHVTNNTWQRNSVVTTAGKNKQGVCTCVRILASPARWLCMRIDTPTQCGHTQLQSGERTLQQAPPSCQPVSKQCVAVRALQPHPPYTNSHVKVPAGMCLGLRVNNP